MSKKKQDEAIAGKLTLELGLPNEKGGFKSNIVMDGNLNACGLIAVLEKYVAGLQQLVREKVIKEGLENAPDLEDRIEVWSVNDIAE